MKPGSFPFSLIRQARTAFRFGRQNGFFALLKLVLGRLRNPLNGRVISKRTVVEYYGFVRKRPVGAPILPGSVPKNTINWFIPPFSFGSGGHLNIFRFVHHLETDGFECRIVIVGMPQPASAKQAHRQIGDWFFPLKGKVYLETDTLPSAHVTIATSWQTAYHVRNFMPTVHRCYFIQDYEPLFYAAGSEYAWAEATYRFGFFGITAGSWLRDKLAAEYGMITEAFGFSFDRDRYRPCPRRNPDVRQVFFYARPPTQRRAFEMGLLILDEVVRRLPDVKVVFAGWDLSDYAIPFEHANAGVVALDALPDLYSQCDAALVLSFTNLSLLPLELMACGIPVVSNRAKCTEWLLNDGNACLAEPTVESLADALCMLLESPKDRERLRTAGLETSALTDWKQEAGKVASMLQRLDRAARPAGDMP